MGYNRSRLYAKQNRLDFLVAKFSFFCWHIIIFSHEEFPYCGVKLLLCIASEVFLSVVCKCSHDAGSYSHCARQELHKIFCCEVILFSCVGSLVLLSHPRTMVVVLEAGMAGRFKVLY